MILSAQSIRHRCQSQPVPLIEPFNEEHLQGASYDVHLPMGAYVMFEGFSGKFLRGRLSEKEGALTLPPGAFCLAVIAEKLNMPNDLAANFHLCPTLARQGFERFIDPGYSGHITVELKNNLQHSSLKLTPGMRIGQIVFTQLDYQTDKPYQGRYQGATQLEEAKNV